MRRHNLNLNHPDLFRIGIVTPAGQTDTDKKCSAATQSRSARRLTGIGNRRGQSLVEFSFVMPLLLIVITGMLSFGIALHNYLVLTNGVNTGAQLLAMSRGQTTDPCSTASTAVESSAAGLTAANISFTFVINGTSYASTSCTSGAANMVQGASAEVKATYPCVFMIYGMGSTCSLESQTTELIQ
jgi:Flp pilus assembly protein TadG